jgi:ankyrin repeat protein
MYACQTQAGWTALSLAAWSGHTECVRELLKGGAEKEAKDNVRDAMNRFAVCQKGFS